MIIPSYKKIIVLFSPTGAGWLTSVTHSGYYRVNEIAVGWFIGFDTTTKKYIVFDPNKSLVSNKIPVFYIENFDHFKDKTDRKNCVIVGSYDQYLKLKNDIGYFGKTEIPGYNLQEETT